MRMRVRVRVRVRLGMRRGREGRRGSGGRTGSLCVRRAAACRAACARPTEKGKENVGQIREGQWWDGGDPVTRNPDLFRVRVRTSQHILAEGEGNVARREDIRKKCVCVEEYSSY
jgi:hypothetical protein